jgi:hypothetical protein
MSDERKALLKLLVAIRLSETHLTDNEAFEEATDLFDEDEIDEAVRLYMTQGEWPEIDDDVEDDDGEDD